MKLSKAGNQEMKSFLAEARRLWPLAKGSLAEVRKPCIRPGCKACATGKKHRAFLFSFKEQGGRRCMYIPLALVSVMRQAIHNGRLFERRMSRMGAELILQFRQRQIGTMSKKKGRKKAG